MTEDAHQDPLAHVPDDLRPGGEATTAADAAGDKRTLRTSGSLQQALAASEAKAKEHYDAYLRARADVENVRRRSQEDLAKAHKFGIESFAEALVPVIDSLDAAPGRRHRGRRDAARRRGTHAPPVAVGLRTQPV